MSHVPEDLLVAFVEGDLAEELAVHIAEHIDTCSSCLARTAQFDSLSAAFAAVADPSPPLGLAESALRLASAPIPLTVPAKGPLVERTDHDAHLPWRELVVGMLLLGVAACLSAWADPTARAIATEPASVVSGAIRLLAPVDSLARAARAALGTTGHGLLLAAGMAAWGLVATWRLAAAEPTEVAANGEGLAEGLR